MKYTNVLNGRRLLLGASLVGVSAAWAEQPVGQWDFNSNLNGAPGGAFSDVQADAGAKTISAKLPASGDQGFLTITPGVNVKSVQIVGDRLVITYE
jgi:hypothetical protein